jgi:hypothetical protein
MEKLKKLGRMGREDHLNNMVKLWPDVTALHEEIKAE